ncbi:transketolase [Streptomyces sp. CC53]|uniref:transketolase n=1 Tax=unclassified Streptomyces TaxID=2593676 RepID=UPI0008DE2C81|nr:MULTISPECIES: transketolase [unclassified Streptomyces]OII62479.1 transketolase [Streptomyces sp. CC53]
MPYEELAELAQQLRADAVRAADAAGSGHPTSAMSAADLAAVLLARHLRYDFDRPDHPGNDRLVLSKGHASPLLYAMYHAAGAVDEEELLGYRTLGSRLEGHPTPRLPWVDVATGSLGQGLPVAVGMAIAGQRLDRIPYQVYVLSGDSEMAEGSVWEAVEHAADSHLDNLTLIVDVNRLGQRGPTRHGHDLDAYARRLHAFGWHVAEIDGHDLQAVDAALAEARSTTRQPTAILARTRKGRGVAAVEDREGKHGKPLPDAEDALAELGGVRRARVAVQRPPELSEPVTADERRDPDLPRYDPGDSVATRNAYGEALAAVGSARPGVVALDAEVSDSTRAEFFAKAHPERFVECYIAEQQLVAAAVGLAARGYVPYASTFAAFLTRAHDFLRMAAVSRAGINVCGSHAGVSIGPDGPSQMGLEDLAMMRSVHGSTVLYPCDANQTARLTAALADLDGVRYLRTTRGATPGLYGPDEEFPVGGSKVLRRHDHDQVTVVAAGITVHEALKAADRLEAEDGIRARVIDLYSVKPVDAATLNDAAGQTGCVLTVEDHHPEGGLGDAVAEVFADGRQAPRTARLAVRTMPASATPEEQLHAAGIDADAIASAVRLLVERIVAH